MPRMTSSITGVTINVADDAVLPAPETQWESGDGPVKRGPGRPRKTDTGSVPVQHEK